MVWINLQEFPIAPRGHRQVPGAMVIQSLFQQKIAVHQEIHRSI